MQIKERMRRIKRGRWRRSHMKHKKRGQIFKGRERERRGEKKAVGTGIALEKSAEHPCLLGMNSNISFSSFTPLSLSLSLSPLLSPSICISSLSMQAPSPSLSALISKKGCLILLHTTTKWRWVQSQSMPSLPLCIYPVFVLIVITFVTFSSSTLENN